MAAWRGRKTRIPDEPPDSGLDMPRFAGRCFPLREWLGEVAHIVHEVFGKRAERSFLQRDERDRPLAVRHGHRQGPDHWRRAGYGERKAVDDGEKTAGRQ